MAFPYQKLEANGVDVAGAATEELLNDFSEKHFKHGADIYQGTYRFDDFDSRIEVSYQVQNPIVFDLAPIEPVRFKRLWISHLQTKGAPNLQNVPVTPPNLRITSKKIKFVITVFKGHTSDVDFSVDFQWDVEARCAVLLIDAGGDKKAVRLEPIKVTFSVSASTILKEIAFALRRIGRAKTAELQVRETRGHIVAFGNPNDPVWCTNVEKLLLFLVNQVLAQNMTNFIKDWDLPRAIEIANGVSISPHYLEVSDKMLIVGGIVNYPTKALSHMDSRVERILLEFREQFNEEFGAMTDKQLNNWKPSQSSCLRWLKAKEQELRNSIPPSTKKRQAGARAYTENLLILSNDHLFDALAKAYLNAHNGWDGSEQLDFLVRAEVGWWFKVDHGWAKVVPHGVEIHANVEVGGYLRGCVPNPDPKHWGEWMCEGICVEIKPRPDFGLQAYPSFLADGVYLNLRLLTQSLALQFCSGVPPWLNALIGWITSMLTAPLLDVLRVAISLFHFKILDYPRYFPGTPLEWTPRLNVTPTNYGPYLAFTGDPKFK